MAHLQRVRWGMREEARQWAELGKGYIRTEIFFFRTELSPDSLECICNTHEDRADRDCIVNLGCPAPHRFSLSFEPSHGHGRHSHVGFISSHINGPNVKHRAALMMPMPGETGDMCRCAGTVWRGRGVHTSRSIPQPVENQGQGLEAPHEPQDTLQNISDGS